jgi:hypothetical protein
VFECSSRLATLAVCTGAGEGEWLTLLASVSLVAMVVRSTRDCICLRRLLIDVGDGDAANAVIRSDNLRGVGWVAATGPGVFEKLSVSMNGKASEVEERRICSISG